MARLLLLGDCLCDCNENVDRQEPDAVLVVGGKVLEERDHLVNDNRWRHRLDELCEVVGGLSADHGGVIVHKLAVVLPEALLRWGCGSGVGCLVETSRGDL